MPTWNVATLVELRAQRREAPASTGIQAHRDLGAVGAPKRTCHMALSIHAAQGQEFNTVKIAIREGNELASAARHHRQARRRGLQSAGVLRHMLADATVVTVLGRADLQPGPEYVDRRNRRGSPAHAAASLAARGSPGLPGRDGPLARGSRATGGGRAR